MYNICMYMCYYTTTTTQTLPNSNYLIPQMSLILFLLIFLQITSSGIFGATITVVNQCSYTVWPGILSNAGSSGPVTTGFPLPPRAARSFQAEPGWSGRVWARTGCSFDPATGVGRCATGDCGTNQVECGGAGANPPVTLAEFTIAGGGGGQDFYDVSLVDGYNLPVVVEPVGGSGTCGSTGCAADLNRMCPSELRAGGGGEGCRSACGAFGTAEFCCKDEHGSPETCRPSAYSEMFKNACPRAYSYAYDDATSTFTCTASDYTLRFCPSLASQKSSRDSSPAAAGGSDSTGPDDLTTWLSNFVTGGSTRSAISFNFNFICTATLIVTLLFLRSHCWGFYLLNNYFPC